MPPTNSPADDSLADLAPGTPGQIEATLAWLEELSREIASVAGDIRPLLNAQELPLGTRKSVLQSACNSLAAYSELLATGNTALGSSVSEYVQSFVGPILCDQFEAAKGLIAAIENDRLELPNIRRFLQIIEAGRPQFQRLFTILVARNFVPRVVNEEKEHDGPCEPHHFRYGGIKHKITQGQNCRLLRHMWGRESETVAFLAESVLWVDAGPAATNLLYR